MNNQTINSKLCSAWRTLLSSSGSQGDRGTFAAAVDELTTSELAKLFQESDEEVRDFIELYWPHSQDDGKRFVVAHLGQSLDGRIAAANGSSRWVTGEDDVVHNHRMRALFDAVVVGAGTVCYDDPQLTVRAVEGRSPVRVVIDPRRRIAKNFKLFLDGEAETLLLCDSREVRGDHRHGQAEIVGIESDNGHLAPRAILATLEQRGLKRIFVEGGGVTVSRFFQCADIARLIEFSILFESIYAAYQLCNLRICHGQTGRFCTVYQEAFEIIFSRMARFTSADSNIAGS